MGKNLPKGDNNILMDYFTHEFYASDCGNECPANVKKVGQILVT